MFTKGKKEIGIGEMRELTRSIAGKDGWGLTRAVAPTPAARPTLLLPIVYYDRIPAFMKAGDSATD